MKKFDCEVESRAAAAESSTSEPCETVIQEIPSAESHFSSGLGRIMYRPAYHPIFGSASEFDNQLRVLEGGVENVRASLHGDYLMSGFHALCPVALTG